MTCVTDKMVVVVTTIAGKRSETARVNCGSKEMPVNRTCVTDKMVVVVTTMGKSAALEKKAFSLYLWTPPPMRAHEKSATVRTPSLIHLLRNSN